MRTRVLILHDGNHTSPCIRQIKEADDYEVVMLKSVENFLDVIQQWTPQLVVIDCHPFVREIIKMVYERRQQTAFGFIVIAQAYNLKDELFAFEHDADHFLLSATPYESFKIRAQKVCSRVLVSRSITLPTSIAQNVQIRFENLIIFPDEQIVKSGSQIVRLSTTELKLLMALTSHPDKILTRDWLKEIVWPKRKISNRSIDAQLTKLKKRVPGLGNSLVSVYGRGYILTTKKARTA